LFEKLVLEKYVDATFQLKTSRDYWQLSFVDLQISSTKLVKTKKFISLIECFFL
jgi:hypothetical protein